MYKLYWDEGTAAMAPQIVLEEAGLDYETVRVDTRAGETRAAAYLAINPAGYVPALDRAFQLTAERPAVDKVMRLHGLD